MNSICNVFDECQRSISVNQKLQDSMLFLYRSADDEDIFFKDFLSVLKLFLVSNEKFSTVERCLDFTAKFSHFLCQSSREEGSQTIDLHSFSIRLIRFLLQHHRASSQDVRFRCCQLLNKILVHMGVEAYLDDDLCEEMFTAMMDRMKDVSYHVRCQAVYALARLQDPNDADCPVTKIYLFHLRYDPQSEVRRAVLINIAGSKYTISGILDRIRDVSSLVRQQGFKFLSKVHIKSLTIAQRRSVLTAGLDDAEAAVRLVVERNLLPSWLRLLEGNHCELLRYLYVELCPKLGEKVFVASHRESKPKEMIDALCLSSDTRLPDIDRLTPEFVFMWRATLDRFRSDPEFSPHLESIMPDAPRVCDFLHKVFTVFLSPEGSVVVRGSQVEDNDCADVLSSKFLLSQLITLASCIDLWDEYGRRKMIQIVEKLLCFDSLPVELVGPLVNLYSRIVTKLETRITSMLELISNIRTVSLPDIDSNCERSSFPQSPKTEPCRRSWYMRHASIKLQLQDSKEQFISAIQESDTKGVEEINITIEKLTKALEAMESTSHCDENVSGEKKTDSATVIMCLTVIFELLQSSDIVFLSPELLALVSDLVIPSIQHRDHEVRVVAVELLGLMCLLDFSLAKQYLILFVQIVQADEAVVRVSAIKAIFDIILLHGTGPFISADETEQDSTDSLISQLASFMDSPVLEIRNVSVEGFCKLLMNGCISSSGILKLLVLLWYNPVSHSDPYICNVLGVFFPSFVSVSHANQEMMGEMVVPCLLTLLKAPLSSPLVSIAESDVAKFLLQLTSSSLLSEEHRKSEGCVHETIAYRILNALLSEPRCELQDARALFLRLLTQLNLSECSDCALLDFKSLTRQLVTAYGRCDKRIAHFLHKFVVIIDKLRSLRSSEDVPPEAPVDRVLDKAGQDRCEVVGCDKETRIEAGGLDCSGDEDAMPDVPNIDTSSSSGPDERQAMFMSISQDSEEYNQRLHESVPRTRAVVAAHRVSMMASSLRCQTKRQPNTPMSTTQKKASRVIKNSHPLLSPAAFQSLVETRSKTARWNNEEKQIVPDTPSSGSATPDEVEASPLYGCHDAVVANGDNCPNGGSIFLRNHNYDENCDKSLVEKQDSAHDLSPVISHSSRKKVGGMRTRSRK